jgi:hypothetical protein
MENKISNKTINSPQYSDSGINGLVKISQTIGGHIDELDDTLGRERRVRCHPNGTREVWTNDRCDLVIYGDNYKMVIGDDNVTVTGTININVNGDCNTTVAGDYNLTILKDMNVSVKGNIIHKCDGAFVTETTNGDIIHNSGSALQQHSVADMITRCGGEYDCRVVEDVNFNAVTTSFFGKNFVCGASGVISIASGSSIALSGASLNFAGSSNINLQSIGSINNNSPLTTITSPTINATGIITGSDFISSDNGSISLKNHTHTSSSSGSPTSTPIKS